jgi:cytoskeletal protein CcmA (bactofilin family)
MSGWVTLSTRRPGSRFQTPTPPDTGATNGSDGQRNSVVLGPNDRLVGQLYIEGDLRVSGKVEGQLEATGDIEIAGSGQVSGTVTAYNRLVVGGSASLIGSDVRVGRLTVEDGATFSGHVTMGKAAIQAPRPVVVEEPAPPPEPEPVPEPAAVEITPVVVEPEPIVKKGKRR